MNVRSGASTDSSVLATIEADAIVTVNGLVDGWYDVTCEYGTEGYIRSDFLDLTESSSSNGDIVGHRHAVPGHPLCLWRCLSQRL